MSINPVIAASKGSNTYILMNAVRENRTLVSALEEPCNSHYTTTASKREPEVRFELTKLARRFTKPILLATKGLRQLKSYRCI